MVIALGLRQARLAVLNIGGFYFDCNFKIASAFMYDTCNMRKISVGGAKHDPPDYTFCDSVGGLAITSGGGLNPPTPPTNRTLRAARLVLPDSVSRCQG